MTARRVERVLAYVLLVLIAVIGFLPFIILAIISFKTRIQVLEVPPSLAIDLEVAARNYANVVFDRGFIRYTVNSIIVTSLAVGAALVLGTPTAYALSRLRFRGRDRWATTILSFRFMPPIAIAIPVLLMMRTVRLDDSIPGLVLPYIAFSLPLTIWILIGFFDEVPRDLDDAALVDGCSRFQVLRLVMLPLVRPGLVVAAIFGAIFIWNEFLVGLYIVNSQDLKTIPLGAAGLISAQRPIDWNVAATVGIVTIIPIFIFSLFIQRYIVRGVTAGAVR